jgi:transketolase
VIDSIFCSHLRSKTMATTSIPTLRNIATRLRIDCVRSTTEAGSGHPTTCLSAAETVAVLFFSEMRYDPKDPRNPFADRFILSKGHAAPILYAAWAEAGLFPREDLLKLRRIDSDLEGHPTPRLPFVDVATGSLGQGICAAIGVALNARRIKSDYRTYVLLGDGEMAEGSVWEAANLGQHFKLDNLCAIVDVNRLGQSRATQLEHDMAAIERRWTAFGWKAIVVDGHDVRALRAAFDQARSTKGQPTVVLAKTIKGKGIASIEGKDGWHGKALKKGEETNQAIAELEGELVPGEEPVTIGRPSSTAPQEPQPDYSRLPAPSYKKGDQVATREAWGTALASLGGVDGRVVALDADVKNSTFSERFEKLYPDRFFECFIAEQVMIGASMGFAARGAIPFPSTFACFLTRAADFIRMAGVSFSNVKYTGSHAGVSIGEDGPSQMGLEDLALMRAVPGCAVLYPCDAVSTERLVVEMARYQGPAYMRTSRPKTPVIYDTTERFPIGGAKVLRRSSNDDAVVVGVGVTVFEALKACDQLKEQGIGITVIDAYSVQPIDAKTITEAARAAGGTVVSVEDHYAAGGLGDAVSEAVAGAGITVHRLAVREMPHSGQPDELIDRYGISARHIVAAVQAVRKAVRA